MRQRAIKAPGSTPEATAFERAATAYAALWPAAAPYAADALMEYVADVLAVEIDPEALVFQEGTVDFDQIDYVERRNPWEMQMALHASSSVKVAAVLARLQLPRGLRVQIMPAVYRFATEPRNAKVRYTAMLVWLHVSDRPSWLLAIPMHDALPKANQGWARNSALANLGRRYAEHGRWLEALAALKKCSSKQGKINIVARLANTYARAGDPAGARMMLEYVPKGTLNAMMCACDALFSAAGAAPPYVTYA